MEVERFDEIKELQEELEMYSEYEIGILAPDSIVRDALIWHDRPEPAELSDTILLFDTVSDTPELLELSDYEDETQYCCDNDEETDDD